ncbi:MAG: glycosyltransferase [bacterium]
MKILLTVTGGGVGGAERYVFELARGFHVAQHKVAVMAGSRGWLSDSLACQNISFVAFPELKKTWNPLAILKFCWSFRGYIKRGAFDVIHLNSSNTYFAGFACFGLKNRPKIVATVHGWSFLCPGAETPRIKKIFLSVLIKALFVFIDKAILVSHSGLDLAAKNRLIAREKCSLINYAVSEAVPIVNPVEINKIREFKASKEYVFGTLARFSFQKNLGLLLEAATRMQNQKVGFVTIGSGPDEKILREKIKNLNLTEKVLLISDFEGSRAAINLFDVFVLTSRYEGLPLTILEAGLSAKPVIASKVDGVPEIIEHGATGRLFQSHNASALVDEMNYCLENRNEVAQMGEVLREKVERDYALPRLIRETENLYRKLHDVL